MKKNLLRSLAMLLGIAVLCLAFSATAFAAGTSTDIPSAYVVFDGEHYYLIGYEDLLNSYISYMDDPNSTGAKLAKLYFDTLNLGFEEHFVAYVSGTTNKCVSYDAVLGKYIDTGNIDETYDWFNSDAATPAFDNLTDLLVLGLDGNVTGHKYVDSSGYEAVVPIENPSVETVDPNDSSIPQHWSNNSWGNLSSTFTYLNEGHTGSRSVKVEVTGYVEGDAKWFFDPVPLENRDYVFSEYYRSNVDTNVIVAVTTSSGDTMYLDLPFAPASQSWTSYEAAFTMPEHGVTATIYHVLAKNGYLITDDYQINLYNYEGFNSGMVTITFDDGWEENTATALPIMKQYGFKSNQFYATTYIQNDPSADPELIRLFINDGHEVGSHSITHPDLTTLSAADVQQELEGSKQFLESRFGITVHYFATPFGIYNTSVKNSIMTYYTVHRTVESGYNSQDNFDVSRLKCMSVLSTTTAAEVAQWVQKAKDEHLWLILLYHRVGNDPGDYDTTTALFGQQMKVIHDAGIPVVTITQALTQINAQ